MFVLVTPVSGAYFVSQLAILSFLCDSGYIPDLVLASSGGSIASYIAYAADWKSNGIKRICNTLCYKDFMEYWCKPTTLSYGIGWFYGSMYKSPVDIYSKMSTYFTSDSIQRKEIWLGCFNQSNSKSAVFCNRSKETSLISKYLDEKDNELTEINYCNGQVDRIIDSAYASASIPIIFPGQKIDSNIYVDGGVCSSSPLSILFDSLVEIGKEHSLHITYVHCHNIDDSDSSLSSTLDDTFGILGDNAFSIAMKTVKQSVQAKTIADYKNARTLISIGGKAKVTKFICSPQIMDVVNTFRTTCNRSLLELYPKTNLKINLFGFKGQDIVETITNSELIIGGRLSWIGDDEPKL